MFQNSKSIPSVPFGAIIALLALLATPAFAQTEALKWKWSVGDTFEVILTQSTHVQTKVDAREKSNEGSTRIGFDWTVMKVAENGDATLEQSLTSIRLETGNPELPSQAVSYDTASDQKISTISKALRDQVMPLIGIKFLVIMSPRGEIKNVSLPQESTALLNQLPDTLRLRMLFSESGLKELHGAAAIVLPEKNLTEGESWTDQEPIQTPFGNFNRKRTYTFVGETKSDGHRFAEFELVSSLIPIKPDADAPGSPSEKTGLGGTLTGKLLESSGSGRLMMDIENGYFTSRKITHRAKTEKPYREMKIISTVTNEIEMIIKKN